MYSAEESGIGGVRVIWHSFFRFEEKGGKFEIKPTLAACTPPLYVLEYIRHARSIP